MKLTQTDDDPSNLYYEVLQSETGLVKMAIHPVLFGYRVRGWLTSESSCRIDWCGGADYSQIQTLYSILRNILLHRDEKEAFVELPGISKIKPFYLDKEFVDKISSHITQPLELVTIKLPKLSW